MQPFAVTDVDFHPTHREGYQSKLSKLLVFTRRADGVISEACFAAMTGAAMDEGMIAIAQTPS